MEFNYYTIDRIGFFTKHYDIYQEDELVYRMKQHSRMNSRYFIFYDAEGNELFHIRRPFSFFTYKFEIRGSGLNEMVVLEKKNLSRQYLSAVEGRNLIIEGKFLSKEFYIKDGALDLAIISKRRFRSKSAYGIAIKEGQRDDLLLIFIIAVDITNRMRRKKA